MSLAAFGVPGFGPGPVFALILRLLAIIGDLVTYALQTRSWRPFCRLVVLVILVVWVVSVLRTDPTTPPICRLIL